MRIAGTRRGACATVDSAGLAFKTLNTAAIKAVKMTRIAESLENSLGIVFGKTVLVKILPANYKREVRDVRLSKVPDALITVGCIRTAMHQ
ncbi:MAG: hypothetical protein DCF17_08095 [Shackletoniella antarctica]|uniref:Uncharacterized protein n=1 Tax=Shackletoniella antarctica TaxID=268115 RepID=A0A2W4WE70_9CYAN|nr:MAG: hypothetical protein DCF17_08095 [Shackletoniella antarctica]